MTIVRNGSPVASPTSDRSAAAEPEQAFGMVRDCFQRATQSPSARNSTRHYRVCGRGLTIQCVGDKLARQIDAPITQLGRSESTQSEPTLTVHLWDVDASRTTPPAIGLPAAQGKYWRSSDGRWVAQFQPHSFTLLDIKYSVGVGWVNRADCMQPWERAKPLLAELTVWLTTHGLVGTHGGFVARDGDGVLLVGKGGSGKTTCALTCLQAGFDFFGDDHVEIEETEGGNYLCHGIYASTALWPSHALRFPQLAASEMRGVAITERPKPCFLLPNSVADSFRSPAAVRAIIVPQVSDRIDTEYIPIGKLQALLAIAPSSLIARFPISAKAGLNAMKRLVARVPCFQLQLGSDLQQIPVAIASLLDEVTLTQKHRSSKSLPHTRSADNYDP